MKSEVPGPSIQLDRFSVNTEESSSEFDTPVLIAKPPKQKNSKKVLLLVAALAASLSICSIAWIAEKNSSSKKKASLIAQEETKTSGQEVTEPGTVSDDKSKHFRKNWMQYITAENSNYAYGVLGGVSNLSVLFSNRTNYVLNEVTAKVTYIKANGKPWKTKFVSIYNMPANSQKKEALQKVNRGKSVEVTITKIVSKQMHFNYTLGKSGKGDDPYFMK